MKRIVEYLIRLPFKLLCSPLLLIRLCVLVWIHWGNARRLLDRSFKMMDAYEERITDFINWFSFGIYKKIFYAEPDLVEEIDKLFDRLTTNELKEVLNQAIEEEDYLNARIIQDRIDAREQLSVLKNKN